MRCLTRGRIFRLSLSGFAVPRFGDLKLCARVGEGSSSARCYEECLLLSSLWVQRRWDWICVCSRSLHPPQEASLFGFDKKKYKNNTEQNTKKCGNKERKKKQTNKPLLVGQARRLPKASGTRFQCAQQTNKQKMWGWPQKRGWGIRKQSSTEKGAEIGGGIWVYHMRLFAARADAAT